MKGLSIINILLVFFFITLSKVTLAQIEIDAQEKLEYEKITEELDFSDTRTTWRPKENKKEEEKEKKEIKKDPITIDPNVNIDGSFTNAIAYVSIVVLLLAVMFMIFYNVKFDKKIDTEIKEDDFIEDIEEIDTIDGFKSALNAGDYRSAIRMQFIKVLQILQENNHINWKPEKTNKDYLRELSGTNQKNGFRKLSGIYELVWYGNTTIERESFEQLNPSFDKFINDFDAK